MSSTHYCAIYLLMTSPWTCVLSMAKLVAKSIIEQLTLQICIYVLNPKPFTPTKDAWNIASPTIEGLNTRHQQTTINHIPISHYLFFEYSCVMYIFFFLVFRTFCNEKWQRNWLLVFFFLGGGKHPWIIYIKFPTNFKTLCNDKWQIFLTLGIHSFIYFLHPWVIYIASFPLVNFQDSLKWSRKFDLE